ncbi:MAG TPA: hypothetical protein VFO36_06750 [Nitrospiraceae bacterium]|nr:hypothetical protein [Nitrospiraceae bacterium]
MATLSSSGIRDRNRHNESILTRALAQNATQQRDVLIEVVVLHDHVRPKRLEQPGLLQQLTRMLQEVLQRFERFGGQRQ